MLEQAGPTPTCGVLDAVGIAYDDGGKPWLATVLLAATDCPTLNPTVLPTDCPKRLPLLGVDSCLKLLLLYGSPFCAGAVCRYVPFRLVIIETKAAQVVGNTASQNGDDESKQ